MGAFRVLAVPNNTPLLQQPSNRLEAKSTLGTYSCSHRDPSEVLSPPPKIQILATKIHKAESKPLMKPFLQRLSAVAECFVSVYANAGLCLFSTILAFALPMLSSIDADIYLSKTCNSGTCTAIGSDFGTKFYGAPSLQAGLAFNVFALLFALAIMALNFNAKHATLLLPLHALSFGMALCFLLTMVCIVDLKGKAVAAVGEYDFGHGSYFVCGGAIVSSWLYFVIASQLKPICTSGCSYRGLYTTAAVVAAQMRLSLFRLLRPLLNVPVLGHAIIFTIGVFVMGSPGKAGVQTFIEALALVAALLLGFSSSQEGSVDLDRLEAADKRFSKDGVFNCISLANAYGFFGSADHDAEISTQFALESGMSIVSLTASLLCTLTALLSFTTLYGVESLTERQREKLSSKHVLQSASSRRRCDSTAEDKLENDANWAKWWFWNKLLLLLAFVLLLWGLVCWLNSLFLLRLVNFPAKRWERMCNNTNNTSAVDDPYSVFDVNSTPAGIWQGCGKYGLWWLVLMIVCIAGKGLTSSSGVEVKIDEWLQREEQGVEAPAASGSANPVQKQQQQQQHQQQQQQQQQQQNLMTPPTTTGLSVVAEVSSV
jgi:hypothetical protein